MAPYFWCTVQLDSSCMDRPPLIVCTTHVFNIKRVRGRERREGRGGERGWEGGGREGGKGGEEGRERSGGRGEVASFQG